MRMRFLLAQSSEDTRLDSWLQPGEKGTVHGMASGWKDSVKKLGLREIVPSIFR